MLIVDAQIHLWNAGNPTSPWHRQIPAYLKEDALKEMDAGGVDAAILTPHTPWDPNANELCMEAARAHPDRFRVVGQTASGLSDAGVSTGESLIGNWATEVLRRAAGAQAFVTTASGFRGGLPAGLLIANGEGPLVERPFNRASKPCELV